MAKQKQYVGSAYIGVVGPDGEIGECRDSQEKMLRRPADSPLNFARATKGYEARQTHLNNFINSNHAFLFLMDHDQYFPADILEKLRSHRLPYVSGLYMRRNYEKLAPVWYRKFNGKWPMEPWVGHIERGKLHQIGASGWGCLLVHREVVMAVRKILKGEWEVIEDDMDIWPYDLGRIMEALRGIERLVDNFKEVHHVPLRAYLEVLKEEIRPLRADNDVVGSDIRFPFFALQAGYQLMGDPDALCGHDVHFPLSPEHLDEFTPQQKEQAQKNTHKYILSERRKLTRKRAEVLGE